MNALCHAAILLVLLGAGGCAGAAVGLGRESCCPSDTILVSETRNARGIACLFDTTLVSSDERARACTFDTPEEEGGAALLLCVDEEIVAATLFVRPLAWDAAGERLLVREAAADDDLKIFVLNVADGQYAKSPQERAATRIGRRGDVFRGWDGDALLLENFQEPGSVRRVVIPDEREP